MEEIIKILKSDDPKRAIQLLTTPDKEVKFKDNWDEYDGNHEILDDAKRPDKVVKDKAGNVKKIEPVSRTVFTHQKKIVNTGVAFNFGSPIKLVLDSKGNNHEEIFKLVKKVWKRARLDSFNKEVARILAVETKCAELFVIQNRTTSSGIEQVLRPFLLAYKTGNETFPYFDEYGDLVAFTRKYKVRNVEGKTIECIDIFTQDVIFEFKNVNNKWEKINEKENILGKIPIVYLTQEEREWKDVQRLIDRLEFLISKFGDTNDYFASPILKVWGEVKGLPEKQIDGKTMEFKDKKTPDGKFEKGGDADYLAWNQAPEAIKLEKDILKEEIYSLTSTPDLSFENLKGSTGISGNALEFMFLDAILKSYLKQEIFEKSIIRRLSILKSFVIMTNPQYKNINPDEIEISVEFTSVLPKNLSEIINTLSNATGGKPVISKKTALKHNPLVDDAAQELENINTEEKSELVTDLTQTVR